MNDLLEVFLCLGLTNLWNHQAPVPVSAYIYIYIYIYIYLYIYIYIWWIGDMHLLVFYWCFSIVYMMFSHTLGDLGTLLALFLLC
jgi:hypothetical protein